MKKISPYPVLLLLLVFIACNPENEEDLYYEPLVDGIYNISVDPEQRLDFTIEPHKATIVNGEFSNGVPFTVEFEANTLQFNEAVQASIQPVTGILDMPAEFQFNFGFVFSPEGVYFSKPGKMTIELPAGTDIGEFRGFYFQGGVPYGTTDAEIWSVNLVPIVYQAANGKKQAVIELPHFSGFVGVSGGDFKCGNPMAAEMCDQLKEILACYVTGKESIGSDDRKKVNQALKDWMNGGLDWLEEHPEELENLWDVEDAIRELLCWKAACLMFNSTMAPFENQLSRIGDLFTGVLIDRLVTANEECLSMNDMYGQYGSFVSNVFFMNLVDELRSGGFLNEDPGITMLSYCNEIATNFYMDPFLDTTLNDYTWLDNGTWYISMGGGTEAVAHSRTFKVYATNLLGEPVEMVYGVDYTIENLDVLYQRLDGETITELIQTCHYYDNSGNLCCPHPCYHYQSHAHFHIVLTTSGDYLKVKAARYD